MTTKISLDYYEYAAFLVTLGLSALIGIFYGCVNTAGQNTVSGYLFGGKQMPMIPVALSLISSFISGVTLIGVPSEVYYFTTQYLFISVGVIVATSVITFVSLPVFFKLQLVSIFEYMELRFGHGVRILTSVLFSITAILYSAVVIYGPALALNQVTGMGVQTISIGVCIVCIFYTTLGGVKAVVWTDTLQSVIMVFSVLVALFIGIKKSGGNLAVIQSAVDGNRIEFFNMDASARISFWSQVIGGTMFQTANLAFNPYVVQRLICLPSLKEAKLSSWIMAIGIIFFFLTSGYTGLVIYAWYKNCDPYTAKLISRPDQIVPYFVMDVSAYFKGICGLFLAGIVSAALSSLATSINTLAGSIYEDFIEQRFKVKPGEERASFLMKCISLVVGVVCLSLVSVVEKLGYILELSNGFTGISSGALLGLFLLGFFHPRANGKGALIGGFTSLGFLMFLMTGNSVNKMTGSVQIRHNVMNVEGCPFNITLNPSQRSPLTSTNDVFPLFKIPVFFYAAIGSLIVIIVGSIASYFVEGDVVNVRLDLLSPWIHKFVTRPPERTYDAVPVKETVALPERRAEVDE